MNQRFNFAATDLQLCDVFDNTVLKLGEAGKDEAPGLPIPAGGYSVMTTTGPTSGEVDRSKMIEFQKNFTSKYAHIDLTGDYPNNGVFDAVNNRYKGDWSKQKLAASGSKIACGDSQVTWYDSPEDVPGGIDAVNAVWAKSVSGYTQPAQTALNWLIGMEQRDVYNGGPHAGTKIPEYTISANFANVANSSYGDWVPTNTYIPGAGTTGGQNVTGENGSSMGDRWTIVRAQLRITKEVVDGEVDGVKGTGVSGVGTKGTAAAGTPVIWQLNPELKALAATPADVDDLVMTDTLPAGASYDAAATEALEGNTAPSSYSVAADGTTKLVWNLGTRTPNQGLGQFRIVTHADPFLETNKTLVNAANIAAEGSPPVKNDHNTTHTVTISQPGSIQLRKSVDKSLDLQDQDQVFKLELKNFSASLPLQSPTVIDVLPYVGDKTNTALVNRNPASKFVGSNKLPKAPEAFIFDGKTPAPGTFYYTTADPSTVPQNLDDDSDPSLWTTTFSNDATAFKFVADNELGTASSGAASGLVINLTTKQEGNAAGDLYANRFTAFTKTLYDDKTKKHQLLTSNQVTVRVLGFSLGDLVWLDKDNDGKFTKGIDATAPEGVSVDVYKADGTLAPNGNTATKANGRWLVNDLPQGDYYVVIPASEMEKGGPLAGWTSQTVGYEADPNTDSNEDEDNNGAQQGDGSIKTGIISLTANTSGNTITGNEPLNDNVASLTLTPGTDDAFSNLTLDIALKGVPGYKLTKSANPANVVAPGGTITYTLTGSNTGNTSLDPVVISDDMTKVLNNATLVSAPKATIAAESSVPAAVVDASGKKFDWSGSLKIGQSVQISYTVKVNANATGVELINTAYSTATPDGEPPLPPVSETTTNSTPDYSLAKTANPASGVNVLAGDTITYSVTGKNTGKTVLDPVVITDQLAKVLNHAKMTSAPVATIAGATGVPQPTVSGTLMTWKGSLKPGESVVIRYTVTLNADASGVAVDNLATSTATPPGLPPVTPPAVETHHYSPSYVLAKTSVPASGQPVNAGGTIKYQVTGSNTGQTLLDPVVITDNLSEVLKNATLVGAPVATIAGADIIPVPSISGTTLTWEGTLEKGQKVVIGYEVKLDDDAEGVIVRNTASSKATPPGLPPLSPPNVETWHPTPGYTFFKQVTPSDGSAVVAGDTLSYTLTGNNFGETNLDPVEVSDNLSEVLAYAELVEGPTARILQAGAFSEADAQPQLDEDKLSWNGALAIGQQVVIDYKVKVKAGFAAKTLTNSASSTATPPGLDPLPPRLTSQPTTPSRVTSSAKLPCRRRTFQCALVTQSPTR